MMHVRVFILILVVFVCCDQTIFANALSVDIKTVSGLLGENGTVIECSYTKENVIKIDYVRIMALKERQTTFAVIVVYVPNGMSSLTPEGQFLKGRVTLANIDQSSTKAVMIFNKLMCIDDTSYRCNVRYTDSSLDGKETTSNNMSIQVQVSPSNPKNLLILDPQNESITLPVLPEGYNVTFVCSGDVGRPPGIFIFQKYRQGHILSMNYTATETSIHSDNCSYYRTSNITIQVTAEDNKAVMRCVVESTLADENTYFQSEPLEVGFAVKMPTIVKHPNKTDYLVGVDTSISLNCKTDGYPKPVFLWYKDNQIDTISTKDIFTITDVTTTNSGKYTCFVSNTFNGVIHTKRVQVYVSIINDANKGASTTLNACACNKTAIIVVGSTCGSIILVLCVILFGVIKKTKKNLNDRSIDYANTTQQQNPSLYEGVDHGLDVHHYDELSRRDHMYNNANFSDN